MSIDRGVDKEDVEYYSAIKRSGTESFAEMWTDLETVRHSEISQKEKTKYCILTHVYVI